MKQAFPSLNFDLKIEIYFYVFKFEELNLEDIKTYLSDFEIVRLNKFNFIKDKYLYAMSRMLLKKIISKKLNVEIRDIVLDYTLKGKPYLIKPSNKLFFNISHTEGTIAIVIAPFEVGVDVENIKTRIFSDNIINYVFHEDEKILINKHKDQNFMKFLFWTRKESLLKAIGVGLIDNISSINSSLTNNYLFGKSWKTQSFNLLKNNIICSFSYELQNSSTTEFFSSNIVIFKKLISFFKKSNTMEFKIVLSAPYVLYIPMESD